MAYRKILFYSSLFSLGILLLSYSVSSKRTVTILGENDWRSMLEGEWMVEFYAPWCPACKALQPVWDQLAGWSDDLGVNVAKIDVTISPGLSGRFVVTALPTIFHVINGEFRQYRGGRDKESLISFLEDKKWKNLDPIPSWKSPGSYQMSVVACFFQVSTVLRGIHQTMVNDYGLPTWCSYAVFAISTILIGAAVGLLLVLLVDFCHPSEASRPSVKTSLENYQGDETDDLLDETGDGQDYDEKGSDIDEVGDTEEDEEEEDEGGKSKSQSEGDASQTDDDAIEDRKDR